MKKFCALLICIFSTVLIYSQVPGTPPQGFSYKATILKANGSIVAARTISLKISILQGTMIGVPVYTEIFHPKTNEYGQIDIIIGESGLGFIPWDQGPFFLKTEFDEKNGTNFITLSITQLLSVPFALYSGSASAANETDPIFKAHDAYQYSPSVLDNGNTAYSWGNHAGLYRPLSWVPSWSDVTGKPSFSTIAMSGSYTDLLNKPVLFDGTWANLAGVPTTLSGFGITDAMTTSHAANGITPLMIDNWNNAYTWGNHVGLYRPLTWLPAWSDVTDKPSFSSVALSGNYNDLTEKPALFDGTWTSLAGKPSSISGYGITDAMTTAHDANVITTGLINNWNNSFAWGNHATAGYIPGTRKVSINGTTLDLSADRNWNVGTVTSVSLSMPPMFSVTNSPVTGTGTLTASLVSQSAGFVLASPAGTSGTPVFRSLAQTDIPDLDWSKIATGKPANLSGYGITDAAAKTYVEALESRISVLETQVASILGPLADNDGDGYRVNQNDCNDNDPSIHPGATEICGDNKDNDCDGTVDEGCSPASDVDGDGFTVAQGDCDDNDPSIHPGATDVCDLVDNDCNGRIDDGACPEGYYCENGSCVEIPIDEDGDGYTTAQGDCDDNNPAIHPGAAEICNDNIDNNCNGLTDCQDPECASGPQCTPVDILMLIDRTGDMNGAGSNLRASMANIINQLKVRISDLAIGLASYQDFPVSPFGSVPDLPYQLYSAVTTNVNAVISSMNTLIFSGGGDTPESGNEALYQAASGAGLAGPWGTLPPTAAGFREGSKRIVIIITQSIFHVPSDYPFFSHGQTEALQELQSSGLNVMGIRVGLNSSVRDLLSTYAVQTNAVIAPSSGMCPTGINGSTVPPVNSVCPLVYDASSDGAGLSSSIVEGVMSLISQ